MIIDDWWLIDDYQSNVGLYALYVRSPTVPVHFIHFAGHGSQASQRNVVTGHKGMVAKIQNKWSHQRNFAIFKL